MSATASDLKNALHRRYNGADLSGEQWVCIEEARSGAGFDGNSRQCDFLAINTYQGRGMQVIGHEIKVALADWKKELADPDKAEKFAQYCLRWYVVMPSELAKKVRDEVPPAWGLLSLSDGGRWTEIQKAPKREPAELSLWWWVGWLAQIDRQAKRRVPIMLNQAMESERRAASAALDRRVEQRLQFADSGIAKLRENSQHLKEATGIDLQHGWLHDFERLKQAWTLAKGNFDLQRLIRQLRAAADDLESVTEHTDKVMA